MTRAAEADEHAARELALWADNDGPSYHRRTAPIYRNLERKIRAGTYDRARAVPFLADGLTDAAKTYALENCSSPGEWADLFPPATRELAAAELLEHLEAEVAIGNSWLPAGELARRWAR